MSSLFGSRMGCPSRCDRAEDDDWAVESPVEEELPTEESPSPEAELFREEEEEEEEEMRLRLRVNDVVVVVEWGVTDFEERAEDRAGRQKRAASYPGNGAPIDQGDWHTQGCLPDRSEGRAQSGCDFIIEFIINHHSPNNSTTNDHQGLQDL
ncbi:hypothetical protein BY996DRAFT_8394612 [Phakopsora pachyrhizi]|nr:hypothetical protein BY996DRAFT_8394612 [Phakopsora pachyrhizi]